MLKHTLSTGLINTILFAIAITTSTSVGAASGKELDIKVDASIARFYEEVDDGKEFSAAAPIGFQFGAQANTVILVFMDDDALDGFRNSAAWEIGVDGSVALIQVGAGSSVDTTNIQDPIVGFVFNN